MESNLRKAKKIFVTVGIATICGTLLLSGAIAAASEEDNVRQPIDSTEIVEVVEAPRFNKEGYMDKAKWEKALAKSKSKRVKKIGGIQKNYKGYLSKSQKKNLKKFKSRIKKSKTIEASKKYDGKINKVLKSAKAKKKADAAKYKMAPLRNRLTKSKGVNYYNGRRETFYTPYEETGSVHTSYTFDKNGIGRDPQGYIVAAASDLPRGYIGQCSLGTYKIWDCGCANGTLDIFVSWR